MDAAKDPETPIKAFFPSSSSRGTAVEPTGGGYTAIFAIRQLLPCAAAVTHRSVFPDLIGTGERLCIMWLSRLGTVRNAARTISYDPVDDIHRSWAWLEQDAVSQNTSERGSTGIIVCGMWEACRSEGNGEKSRRRSSRVCSSCFFLFSPSLSLYISPYVYLPCSLSLSFFLSLPLSVSVVKPRSRVNLEHILRPQALPARLNGRQRECGTKYQRGAC